LSNETKRGDSVELSLFLLVVKVMKRGSKK